MFGTMFDYMSTPFDLHDLMLRKIVFTNSCVVMQFTGLKDKNDKEIYEGDIVRFLVATIGVTKDRKEKIHNSEVISISGCFTASKFRLSAITDIEVIGNVYQNKDLLNATQE